MVYGEPWAAPTQQPGEEAFAKMRRREKCQTTVKSVLLTGLAAYAPISTLTIIGFKLAVYAYPDLANNTVAGHDTLELYKRGEATMDNVVDAVCGSLGAIAGVPTDEPQRKTEPESKENSYSKTVGYRHRPLNELPGPRQTDDHDEL
ncbi:hypothetical protein NX059_008210 [Plenodomus lindquistii]|nr:hypothetical protein NX059_008210 [Plenodomus lindquistii]